MKLSEFIKKFGDKQVDVDELIDFIIEDKVWLPKKREVYWYVSDLGKAGNWINNNDDVDEAITSSRQVYRTRTETEFARDKEIFLEFMRKEFLRNSNVIDWEDSNQKKWYLEYDYPNDCVSREYTCNYQFAKFNTTNYIWLKKFINECEDDIKKYYFEVAE